jgi:Plavaka transposase
MISTIYIKNGQLIQGADDFIPSRQMQLMILSHFSGFDIPEGGNALFNYKLDTPWRVACQSPREHEFNAQGHVMGCSPPDEPMQLDNLNTLLSPQSPGQRHGREYHPLLTGEYFKSLFIKYSIYGRVGNICQGTEVPQEPHREPRSSNIWDPYENRAQFETADFIFRRNQMSAGDIDCLLALWSATLARHGESPPFKNHRDLYQTIDSTTFGCVNLAPWESFTISYKDDRPTGEYPSWMDKEFEVWYRNPDALLRNLIANPSFANKFDFVPYHEYHYGKHRFCDFMSGDWAWKQAVSLFIFAILQFTDVYI